MMKNDVLAPELLAFLPESFHTAQKAIDLPEVQEIIQKLARYNLGVYMPHQYNPVSRAVEVVEEGKIQMENDLQISFISELEATKVNSLPVGWFWKNNGVQGSAKCFMACFVESDPKTGRSTHRYSHK